LANRIARKSRLAALNGLPRSTIHELRTPLTSIRGYAQLLLKGAKNPEQSRRACETIFRESDRLAGLLNQLSKVAEVTVGPVYVTVTRFDLENLLSATVDEARTRWPAYTFANSAGSAAEVVADPQSIRELLTCLLDNAASYSKPGSTVEASVQLEAERAIVALRDQGIGIPAEEREAVFECFRRASNVAKAGLGASRGLGVGLYVARAIANQAGGELWAESELDRGSTFYLALPLAC